MVKINYVVPTSEAWTAWRVNCEGERVKFIAAIENGHEAVYQVTDAYKPENIRKSWFFNEKPDAPFWLKCAYCEESIGSQDGDVEHFRPKKMVTDAAFRKIAKHPGYYWLAYEWTNLLPSCLKCNQKRKIETQNGTVYVGKQNRFPLADEANRVFSHIPGDVAVETPLLINPLLEDPEDHLEVVMPYGIMKGKSPRGEACINIFGLNVRIDLVKGRKTAIEAVAHLVGKFDSSIVDNDLNKCSEILNRIGEYLDGRARFSLAGKCALRRMKGSHYLEWFSEMTNEVDQGLNQRGV